MEITDIIGKGKAFEPPFRRLKHLAIVDKNGRYLVDSTEYSLGIIGLPIFSELITVTDHIVELLNERWKDGTTALIKDFRKWRNEKYKEAFNKVITEIVYSALVKAENCGEREISQAAFGELMLRYGINHRTEILKKVKI